MTNLDNYKVHMSITNDSPSMPLRSFTENKWGKLPHIILTSEKDWYSIVLDCEGQVDNEIFFDAQSPLLDGPNDKTFNEAGDY